MRLDKYLKVSRLIKRRTVAKEVSEAGRISINGKVAKASSEVKINDILEIAYGNKKMKIKVQELKESVPAGEAKNLYHVLEE